jgi:membrane protease YdiL (CAAX protease family)
MSLAVGVPLLIGQLGMSWPTDRAGALVRSGALQLAVLVPGSIAEEIQFRGFLLQQLKHGCGSVVGVSATSVLFGIVHLMNPNGNWIEAAIIALVGVWFGILVLGTGSLWLTFGLHTGWNLVEGFVLGQPVSGYTISVPLMRRTHVGSAAWTGGAFGPEGSIWLAILLGIGIVVSLLHFRRQRLAGSARHEPQAVATAES